VQQKLVIGGRKDATITRIRGREGATKTRTRRKEGCNFN
jgi:hypothetical protein